MPVPMVTENHLETLVLQTSHHRGLTNEGVKFRTTRLHPWSCFDVVISCDDGFRVEWGWCDGVVAKSGVCSDSLRAIFRLIQNVQLFGNLGRAVRESVNADTFRVEFFLVVRMTRLVRHAVWVANAFSASPHSSPGSQNPHESYLSGMFVINRGLINQLSRLKSWSTGQDFSEF